MPKHRAKIDIRRKRSPLSWVAHVREIVCGQSDAMSVASFHPFFDVVACLLYGVASTALLTCFRVRSESKGLDM
uniref:Uncharacterized protein n=2 Tax=Physcomitrium patens TaxID=3218 RepID=A0A2K1IMT9_PHYPA|nr:hypothetical protein PHYPA_026903 [Physcomitrium patens]